MAKNWTGAAWNMTCNGTGAHTTHFQNSWNHPSARKGYVWYWDVPASGDVQFTGDVGATGHGIWGSVIVRGNLINYAGDNYTYTGAIPSDAWEQYGKISSSAGDTSATNEYPGDDGDHKNRGTFNFGGETWTKGQSPPPAGNTDVGFRGFLYVGGNFTIQGPADINGAIWAVGNVTKKSGIERTIIFFDDALNLPTLNVVLTRQSWDEIAASSTPWL
jgi:hypothetical protein